MRHARDTFLHYLADNLTGLTVNNVRFDSTRPSHNQLMQNSINIEFINDRLNVSSQNALQLSLDAIYDDELKALDAVRQLWALLAKTEITPLLSYDSSLTSPTKLGPMLRWSSKAVKFNKLVSDLAFRYNSHIILFYSDPTMLA